MANQNMQIKNIIIQNKTLKVGYSPQINPQASKKPD